MSVYEETSPRGALTSVSSFADELDSGTSVMGEKDFRELAVSDHPITAAGPYPRRTSRKTILPVAGIRQIAFFTMQVGVDPSAVGRFDLLRDLMRAFPVSAPVVPQRLKERRG